jgi:MFS family permease
MNVTTSKLRPRQQAIGRRLYTWFARMNGISMMCLAENVLILYALEMGMPEWLVGVLGSFMFLTMPFTLTGRKFVARWGGVRTASLMWIGRNSCALVMAAAPLVASVSSPMVGVGLLLLASLSFYVFRSIGIVGLMPLVGELTTDANRGQFLARNTFNFNLFNLLTMIAVVLAMRFMPSIETFQGIIVVGSMCGFIAAAVISRVAEAPVLQQSARQPIGKAYREVLDNRRMKRLMVAQAMGVAAIVVVVPLSMAAVKKGYGTGDDMALILALVHISGGMAVNLFSSIVIDHTGPRPMILLCGGLLMVSCLMWVFAPPDFVLPYGVIIFLLNGAGMFGMQMSLMHYMLAAVPSEQRVPMSLLFNLSKGLSAGLAGAIIGSGLIRALQFWGMDNLLLYRWYFGTVFVMLVGVLAVMRRLERLGDWTVNDVLGLFISPRDFRGLLAMTRLTNSQSAREDSRHIAAIRKTPSAHTEPALVALLDSPDFWIRSEALNAMRHVELTEEGKQALLSELKRGEYTTAYIAANVISEKKIEDARPLLRDGLRSEDPYLQSKCMLALGRMRDEPSYPLIRDMFRETINPRIIIHGAATLAEIGDDDALEWLLQKAIQPGVVEIARFELLYYAARMVGCGDEFYQVLKMVRRDPQSALPLIGETEPPPQGPGQQVLPDFPVDQVLAGDLDTEDLTDRLEQSLARLPLDDMVSATVRRFMARTPPEKLYPLLIYCLWTIVSAVDRRRMNHTAD